MHLNVCHQMIVCQKSYSNKTASGSHLFTTPGEYRVKMHQLAFGYIRALDFKWMISGLSADIYCLCFSYFYAGDLFEHEERTEIIFWLDRALSKRNGISQGWWNPASEGLIALFSPRIGMPFRSNEIRCVVTRIDFVCYMLRHR